MKKLILCGALLCAFSLSAFAGQEVDVRDPAAVLADGSRALKVINIGPTGAVAGAGDASAANQTTGNTSLSSIDGKIPSKGAATPANSVPVIQATATTVVSSAIEASHVLLASAGRLVSLHWLNTKTSAQYLLIMNSATVPSDGAVTLLYPPIYMPPTSNGSLTFPTPLTASTGISVANSSTGTFSKTVGSADCIFTAQVQ